MSADLLNVLAGMPAIPESWWQRARVGFADPDVRRAIVTAREHWHRMNDRPPQPGDMERLAAILSQAALLVTTVSELDGEQDAPTALALLFDETLSAWNVIPRGTLNYARRIRLRSLLGLENPSGRKAWREDHSAKWDANARVCIEDHGDWTRYRSQALAWQESELVKSSGLRNANEGLVGTAANARRIETRMLRLRERLAKRFPDMDLTEPRR